MIYAQENDRRRAENRRRMAMGEDRDESDGLLNADPLKDIESFVKGDEAILPHKRFIKQARKTLQHSARIAEREVMALQAERYLETVKRNAARYGESLAASGLTGDRESVGVPSRDDDEEPPKKKSKKAKKKPAARKPAARKKRGRAAAAEEEEEAPADTRPERFCDNTEPLPAAETSTTVWKSKFYGAVVLNHRAILHAIDATPARWRGDVVSSPLDRARTAASSPGNNLVKNCTRRTG